MKNAVSDKSTVKPRTRPKRVPVEGLDFVEVGGGGGAAPDARERLAAFYAKYPLRTRKRNERGIVESLKADRDRR